MAAMSYFSLLDYLFIFILFFFSPILLKTAITFVALTSVEQSQLPPISIFFINPIQIGEYDLPAPLH